TTTPSPVASLSALAHSDARSLVVTRRIMLSSFATSGPIVFSVKTNELCARLPLNLPFWHEPLDRSLSFGTGAICNWQFVICNFDSREPRDFKSPSRLRLVLFQLAVQRGLADFEQPRGQHLVSVHLGECVQDGLSLQFCHGHDAIVRLAYREQVDGRA